MALGAVLPFTFRRGLLQVSAGCWCGARRGVGPSPCLSAVGGWGSGSWLGLARVSGAAAGSEVEAVVETGAGVGCGRALGLAVRYWLWRPA